MKIYKVVRPINTMGIGKRKTPKQLADELRQNGYLTEEQMNKIVKVTGNVRDRLLFLILSRTGRRIGEVLNVERDDVNIKKRLIRYSILKKGKPFYKLQSFDREIFNCLTQLFKTRKIKIGSQYRRIRKKGQRRLINFTDSRALQLTKYYGKKVGIEYVGVGMKALRTHHFRHGFAVAFLKRSNGDIVTLNRILEHEDLNQTMAYLHLLELEDVDKKYREVMGIE